MRNVPASGWPSPDDTSPRAVLERALRGARVLARAARESSPCPACDPGGEGVEIGSEVLRDVEAALEVLEEVSIEKRGLVLRDKHTV